jgi:hypothetical protein
MKLSTRHLVPAGFAALALVWAAAAPAPKPPTGTPAHVQSVNDLRAVGTAMFTWYKDELAPKRSQSAHDSAEEASKNGSQTLADIPVISREDLAKVLVPKYIASLPQKDAWGRPYEFRLNTQDPNAIHVMAVRTAGKDGAFSGTEYKVGELPKGDENQDVVWEDGYFVRWPSPAEK